MTAPTLPDQATFSLTEVAEITGFTLRSIQEACAADPPRIAHRHFGRQRVLTREQLADFIASTEVEPHTKPKAPTAEVALIEKHREKVGARLARKRGRRAA